jgi:sugar/nucleoside kinase (ribokinase family)
MFANAAGAIVASRSCAITAMPSKDEVLDFLKNYRSKS